jgi:hypothetical protein
VTTEDVLDEFLTAMAGAGAHLRHVAAALTRMIMQDAATRVVPQSHFTFLRGLEFLAADRIVCHARLPIWSQRPLIFPDARSPEEEP